MRIRVRQMTSGHLLAGTFACLVLALSGAANGSGFAILEQSAKRNGAALAGGGASAVDASAAWFNPAAMTELDHELHVAGHGIFPKFEFRDGTSRQEFPGPVDPAVIVPLLPGEAGTRDGADNAFVPHFSYVVDFTPDMRLGITLNSPFGLTTDYGRDWRGKYQAVKSEIIDFNINPSIGWRVNDNLSLGAGFSVNYVEAELTNAIDFAAVCAEAAGGSCPNGASPGQGEFDGFVSNEGDDTSYGFNLGMLYEFDQGTRFGLTYRSDIDHDLEGRTDFTTPTTLGGLDALGPALGGALQARFADTSNHAALTLPANAAVSFFHRFDGTRYAVMADAEWIEWSSIQRLRIELDNPQAPALEEELRWDDSWRVSLGGEYYLSDDLTLRAGVAFDESPIPGPELRSPRLPSNDRTWLAGGLTWHLSESSEVDFALAHTFVDDTDIDRVGSTLNRVNGTYDSHGTIVSAAFNYRFD